MYNQFSLKKGTKFFFFIASINELIPKKAIPPKINIFITNQMPSHTLPNETLNPKI